MPAKRQSRSLKAKAAAAEHDGFGRDHVTEIQRARMIAGMIDVISERSRANATVAHVVARSGVSRRTFYEVFDDFEDCFLAALDESIAQGSVYVLAAYDPRARWRIRIRAALIGLLEFLEDEPAMGHLCTVETLGAGRRVHERRMRVIVQATAAVDEGRMEQKASRALPPLTAEGVVGGVLSVLHARLIAGQGDSLIELTGPLMGMVVLPYLGPAAALKESARPAPERRVRTRAGGSKDPLRNLEMRLTYRTVRVLLAIAASPDASNREVGASAGIDDQGQISKLLSRLERLGLIENGEAGQVRGVPNAWSLTKRGVELERLVADQTSLGVPA
jgi:AcrR family transcriptional regulator/DNA-binding MarR family transcriptional regulator